MVDAFVIAYVKGYRLLVFTFPHFRVREFHLGVPLPLPKTQFCLTADKGSADRAVFFEELVQTLAERLEEANFPDVIRRRVFMTAIEHWAVCGGTSL
jgi:hypothetical protein